MSDSPLLKRGLPSLGGAMVIRRERAAIVAMEHLRSIGADVQPTHRLPNGLGYI